MRFATFSIRPGAAAIAHVPGETNGEQASIFCPSVCGQVVHPDHRVYIPVATMYSLVESCFNGVVRELHKKSRRSA